MISERKHISESDMRRIAQTSSTVSYGCTRCNFFTATNKALKDHKQSMHSTIKLEDSTKTILKNKRSKLEEKLSFICNHCDFKCEGPYQLNLHKRRGHNRNVKKRFSRRNLSSNRYPCTKCDFTTRKRSELKVHVEVEHNKRGGKTIFECNLCVFKTLRSNYFDGHKQAKHEGVKYDCNGCEYQATTRGNLNRHKHKYHPTLH